MKKDPNMEIPTAKLKAIFVSALLLFVFNETAAAGGPFGPPQPLSREAAGLQTAFGYWYREDEYDSGGENVIRQNQIYSQLGYGAHNWMIYGRIGGEDLSISDAFRPTQASTATSTNDFEGNWKLIGTLGAKGFYPFNKVFGMGVFLQGSYAFGDHTDHVSGTYNGGTPFSTELKAQNLWEVNFGLGFQATAPKDIKLYLGPFFYYSEAKMSPSANIPGLEFSAGSSRIENETKVGGFAGVDLPLGRGFRLNVEGQYSAGFSVGAAVTFSY
jgi:hypothetical protein